MKQLNFDFENCFGISKFKETIDFKTCNTVMIYAPNGTMKTSFAKTYKYLVNVRKVIKEKDWKKLFVIDCTRIYL